jgi:hypothetical protein
VIGPVGVGVEVGNVVDEVGKVVGVVDEAGVCISSSPSSQEVVLDSMA